MRRPQHCCRKRLVTLQAVAKYMHPNAGSSRVAVDTIFKALGWQDRDLISAQSYAVGSQCVLKDTQQKQVLSALTFQHVFSTLLSASPYFFPDIPCSRSDPHWVQGASFP